MSLDIAVYRVRIVERKSLKEKTFKICMFQKKSCCPSQNVQNIPSNLTFHGVLLRFPGVFCRVKNRSPSKPQAQVFSARTSCAVFPLCFYLCGVSEIGIFIFWRPILFTIVDFVQAMKQHFGSRVLQVRGFLEGPGSSVFSKSILGSGVIRADQEC